MIHLRDAERLALFVRLLEEETRDPLSGNVFVRTRRIELMLIDALRTTCGEEAPPGLLRGLAVVRLVQHWPSGGAQGPSC